MRRHAITLAGCAVVLWSACGDGAGPGEEPRTETFSFEGGLEGWSPDATDILVGEEPIDWSVTTTAEAATDGERSVRLTLDNLSDAGKVWIERRFELEPETSYDVRIEFDLGTSDFGSVNLWTVIAGASSRSPETAEDLESAFRDETGHGRDEDLGLLWVGKCYDLAATTDPDGALHVMLGVWGTFEVTRTYYVDAVLITFTKAEAQRSS